MGGEKGRRGNGREGEKGRGFPRIGSHPHVRSPEKYPDLYAVELALVSITVIRSNYN